MAKIKIALALAYAFCISGCTDPYDSKVPQEGYAPGESEKIASRLEKDDQDLFRHWAERMRTGIRTDQDNGVQTVRSAINAERQFEAAQAEAARQVKIRAADENRKKDQIEEQHHQAALAFEEIKKSISVDVTNFDRAPLWGGDGGVIGYQWRFVLKARNKTDSTISAFGGTLAVSDSFGTNQESFGGHTDLTIQPRSSASTIIVFPNNDASNLQNIMRRGSQINARFIPTSVAFSDGRSIISNPVR